MTGPAQSADLRTPQNLEAERFKSADRIRRACIDGSLHAHRVPDRPHGRWRIPFVVALAWQAGRDEHEQQRVCPVCGPTVNNVTPLRGPRGVAS